MKEITINNNNNNSNNNTNGLLDPDHKKEFTLINTKKRSYYVVGFAVLEEHRLKIKESEILEKYLDLVRELKKLWNMKVTVRPIVVCALGMVPKDLKKRLGELDIRGRIDTIQTTAPLK